MNQYLESWLKLEEIFSPNYENMKSLDPRKEIDWTKIEQIELGSAVAAGCALIEQAGLKGSSKHIEIIFELINSFIHNGFDLSRNRNSSAKIKYYSSRKWEDYTTNNGIGIKIHLILLIQ